MRPSLLQQLPADLLRPSLLQQLPADLVGRVASFLHIDDVFRLASSSKALLAQFGDRGLASAAAEEAVPPGYSAARAALARDVAALLDAAHGRGHGPPAGADTEPPHRAHRTPRPRGVRHRPS